MGALALVEPHHPEFLDDGLGLGRRLRLRRKAEDVRLGDLRHRERRRARDGPLEEPQGIAPVEIERLDGLVERVDGFTRRTGKCVPLTVGQHFVFLLVE